MLLTKRFHYTDGYYQKCGETLDAALRTAPYYRAWRRFDPGPFRTPDERFAAMPELNKKGMRAAFPNGLVPRDRDLEAGIASDQVEYTFTSGTTGEKVVNIFNQDWWSRSEAASWKLNANLARFAYPQKTAKLASSLNVGISCEEDLPMDHRILGTTLYLNEKNNLLQWQPRHFARMARELAEFRPVILEANPSLLAQLAFWAMDTDTPLVSPEVIVFTYEFPSAVSLSAIRKVFSAPFVSSYGSTETGFVMEQCENGKMHQNTEFCRIDYQPLKEEFGGPEIGRILVSTFGNPWNRIIRFDIGDLIRLAPSAACACGRGEGLIAESVEGRTANVTFAVGGGLVTTGMLDRRLALIPELRDYALTQKTPSCYELQAVLTDDSARVKAGLEQALREVYGENGRYKILPTRKIMTGPAGKYRRTQTEFEFDEKGLFQ